MPLSSLPRTAATHRSSRRPGSSCAGRCCWRSCWRSSPLCTATRPQRAAYLAAVPARSGAGGAAVGGRGRAVPRLLVGRGRSTDPTQLHGPARRRLAPSSGCACPPSPCCPARNSTEN